MLARAEDVVSEVESSFKNIKPDEMYKNSLLFFNKGDFARSVAGFRYLLRRYPTWEKSAYAQYWIGESYYAQKQFATAADEYKKVLVRYGESEKKADATLKLGICKLAINEHQDGKRALNEVIKNYPGTPDAEMARRALLDSAMDNLNEREPGGGAPVKDVILQNPTSESEKK